MTATRQDVIDRLRQVRKDVDEIVERAPADAWASASYEGWTARDLLSHVASMSGVASFVMTMAQTATGDTWAGGGGFDLDAFNAQQIAMRAELSVDHVADEVRANLQRDIQAVERAGQALLDKHFVASWGNEGPVAQVICDSLTGHLGGHIADMRRALGL